MNYEQFEKWIRRNRYTSIILAVAFILTVISQFIDFYTKLNSTGGPELSVIDIVDSEPNVLEFKIKNSGDDSAFLKRIEFIFETGTQGCDACFPFIANDYFVTATIANETISIEPVNFDKTNGEILKKTDTSEMDNASQEKVPSIVGKSNAPLKISQVVPPKGVDSFKIRFVSPDLGGSFYYDFSAKAVIYYDKIGKIQTNTFHLYIRSGA